MTVLRTTGRWGVALLMSVGMVAGALLAGPQAFALPMVPRDPGGTQNPTGVVNCGDPKDNVLLWQYVDPAKGITPAKPGNNLQVVWPNNDSKVGFAFHNGVKGGNPLNYLMIPTARIRGIECGKIWDSNAPKYFKDAYDNIKLIGKGQPGDWALGIESANNRSFDQMHIHMTRLQGQARKDIDAAVKAGQVAKSQSEWATKEITVMGRKLRAWNASNMDHQFFFDVNQDIVLKLQKASMGDQTMLIVANQQGPGFIVLNSDKTIKGGVDNIEMFLYKG